MNILRHKSWHVRNRNNITRVRKDEEKARNEELEKEKRIALADSERRVHLLRQKISKNNGSDANDGDNTNTEVSAPGTHLDIFQDFDDKVKTKNKDHEKEMKDETEKFEKKTGILNYLVDKDMDSEQNWYLDSHEKRMKLKDNKTIDKYSEKQLKDMKAKKFDDPIETMRRYLDAMKPKTDSKSGPKHKTSKQINKSIESIKPKESSLKIKSKKSKKHKKNKKKKRSRHSRHSTESSDSDDNKVSEVSKNLEQLRAERLERERIERERTRLLLSGKSGAQSESVILDDRRRTYNSQFNPEIARQNNDL